MKPLGRVARDILGMASSSAGVERLFSKAGNVADGKRNLGPEMLLKQVCVKTWTSDQGFLTLKDIEEML